MPSSVRDRPYGAFLSHAHADKAVVDRLHGWLEKAGLHVWYDARQLAPGASIASELGDAIGRCRSALIVLSKASVDSPWVKDEWNAAVAERDQRETRDFRVVPVRIEECVVPGFLKATKWVDLVGRFDDLAAWAELLAALHADEIDVDVERPIDLYVSRSWQVGREQALADQVLERFATPEVRLVGDSPDWPSFSGDRIRSIMRSCCGVVAIIPKRPRTADDDKLKYFIREVRWAVSLDLPLLVVAEEGADLPSDLPVRLRAPAAGVAGSAELSSDLGEAMAELLDRAHRRPRSGHVFLATDFDDSRRACNETLRRMIQQATGLRCVVGEGVSGDSVHSTIVGLIRDAVWVVADISGNALNTCIEAGAARGAGVDCTLVARKPYLQQPFMLRGMELATYADDIDLLAILHRAAGAYRRKILTVGGAA